MLPVVWRSVAETELAEATDWYATRSPEAARRFVALVDATVERIGTHPAVFPLVGPTLRRAIVPRWRRRE